MLQTNKLLKNKTGGEKIFSIWWFATLIIIGVGIVVGVLIYYSADIDVRTVEAEILSEKIIDCFIKNSFLNQEILNTNSFPDNNSDYRQVRNSFDIFQECNLKKDLFNNGGDFYFNITLYNGDTNFLINSFIGGNTGFERDCRISKGKSAENYPQCVEKQEPFFYYSNNQIKKGNMRILTASNQKGKSFSKKIK